jgi:hypothetical protein
MKHPILRILFLFATVAACFCVPVVMDIDLPAYPIEKQTVEPNVLHVAGQTFPIAGQEETEDGIILRAQDEAEIGELVRLDASASNVDGLTWQILPHTKDFEVIEDGRRAFFSSRVGGSYLIIIAGAKGGVPYLKHHTIDVLGGDPPPPPGPEGLGTKVRRWTKAVGEYKTRKVHALAVAAVFRKLANAEEVTVDAMLDATATANSAILGEDLEKWFPLLEPLGEELDALMEDGKLETREQYKTVWLQIADGIEKGI